MAHRQKLAAYLEDYDALPLSGRLHTDVDFENLSRWVDGRLAGDGGGMLEWHIVLADDDDSNRLILSSLLEKCGVTVTAVENGKQVLDALMKNAADLILLDINMPVMDGLETARAIRARGDSVASLPLIAITSDVSPVRLAEMRDAGFDVCMEKPVRRDNLFQVILGTLSRSLAN